MELFDRTTNRATPTKRPPMMWPLVAAHLSRAFSLAPTRSVFFCTGHRLLKSVVPSLPCPGSALHGSCCQQSSRAVNINICIAHVRAVRYGGVEIPRTRCLGPTAVVGVLLGVSYTTPVLLYRNTAHVMCCCCCCCRAGTRCDSSLTLHAFCSTSTRPAKSSGKNEPQTSPLGSGTVL